MFTSPKYYFNRELSWLKFNQRVLLESMDTTNPLMERLRFLAIAGANLDEFFMIRVAGLRHQAMNGIVKYDAAHMDAKAQLKAIDESVQRLVSMQYTYLNTVLEELESYGFYFTTPDALDVETKTWLRHYFEEQVYPVVTPLAVDSGHPFPFLANHTMNAIVRIFQVQPDGMKEYKIAILPIPSVLDRIIEVPTKHNKEHRFVYLEDVITYYATQFFQGYGIEEYMIFRITRDADLEIDEAEATDLLTEVEASLRRRRRGDAVRIEVAGMGAKDLLGIVLRSVELEEKDVYRIDGHLDCRMYFDFSNYPGYDDLRYKPFEPKPPSELIGCEEDSILDIIRKRDIFVHHPFESFNVVEQFVAQAAIDPNVLAIKQTLYRVSGDSPIISALIKAADNGKQVTVLMEVKARFDEENNIIMARRLEKAGCHVIYGLKGLKTHSKITMVVRREEDGIRRYVHLATGNYNGKTARIYTDCGIFTCNDEYGADASRFFNLISGYSDPPIWNKFIVAPLNLRERIMALIEEEIEATKCGEEGYIIAKMNSLLDKRVIAKLYEASSHGVKIDLIVRGICTLRPGIPGVSDHITVRSIVGRFLEHHRLFYFRNRGNDKIFLSSADWMPRNLNERVELMIPIEDKRHKARIKCILDLYLADTLKAHVMRADGSYKRPSDEEGPLSAQEELMEAANTQEIKEHMTVIERFKPMFKMKE
ncbi:polyphosphate kinase 1 [Veillonella caviae]|uniref:polyphosphate kinase 1 n=2 Tax=Veillonella caviae TaxID=248316 RepID=UPI002A91D611|nr:polyphosphate kinase 1 [Veillonella caviae]MDY5408689.1 polyphosphate kinase 1 [Veillonella caviae]